MEQSWEMISDHFATQGGGTGDTASSRQISQPVTVSTNPLLVNPYRMAAANNPRESAD